MICPECGAILEDDAKFCTKCGCELECDSESISEPESIASETEETVETGSSVQSIGSANVGKIISLVVGSLLIIIGLIRVFSAGTSISSTSFGGDFYTYTYQGIVAISEILASIDAALGWIVAGIGALIDIIAIKH